MNMAILLRLLAAKSVFRFGELNKAQDIKTTEYVLIGTLASFTVAILVGFATLLLIVTIQRMLPFPYRRSRTAVGAHKPLLANEKSVK